MNGCRPRMAPAGPAGSRPDARPGEAHELNLVLPGEAPDEIEFCTDVQVTLVVGETCQQLVTVLNEEPQSQWAFTQSSNRAACSAPTVLVMDCAR